MSDNDTPDGADVRYPQIVRTIRETPWAILPATLATILDIVGSRANGVQLSEDEIAARVGASPARRDLITAGSVAVLPIYGVIVPKADLFTQMSGGTPIQRLSASFQAALDDPEISAILLDIDSPGGMADMVPEFAAEMRAARGKKPIVAVANTVAASAAYWLGAQADEFVVTPSGQVGSIGVFAAHEDISAMEEKLGVKTTLISAGKYKTEGNPFEPLSDEARAAIQSRVDEMYALFTADVAKGRRGVKVEDVRGGFGEGRVLSAKSALKAGMIDRIETFDSALARMLGGASAVGARAQLAEVLPAELLSVFEGDDPPTVEETIYDPEAAESGLSYAQQAEALHASAEALNERTRSLAEFRDRGRLGASKRERLTACTEALRETVTAFEGVLAETDPNRDRDALRREFVRYERLRSPL